MRLFKLPHQLIGRPFYFLMCLVNLKLMVTCGHAEEAQPSPMVKEKQDLLQTVLVELSRNEDETKAAEEQASLQRHVAEVAQEEYEKLTAEELIQIAYARDAVLKADGALNKVLSDQDALCKLDKNVFDMKEKKLDLAKRLIQVENELANAQIQYISTLNDNVYLGLGPGTANQAKEKSNENRTYLNASKDLLHKYTNLTLLPDGYPLSSNIPQNQPNLTFPQQFYPSNWRYSLPLSRNYFPGIYDQNVYDALSKANLQESESINMDDYIAGMKDAPYRNYQNQADLVPYNLGIHDRYLTPFEGRARGILDEDHDHSVGANHERQDVNVTAGVSLHLIGNASNVTGPNNSSLSGESLDAPETNVSSNPQSFLGKSVDMLWQMPEKIPSFDGLPPQMLPLQSDPPSGALSYIALYPRSNFIPQAFNDQPPNVLANSFRKDYSSLVRVPLSRNPLGQTNLLPPFNNIIGNKTENRPKEKIASKFNHTMPNFFNRLILNERTLHDGVLPRFGRFPSFAQNDQPKNDQLGSLTYLDVMKIPYRNSYTRSNSTS